MKEQTRGKRLLSILLCFVMMLSLVPSTVFAVNVDTLPNKTSTNGRPASIYIGNGLWLTEEKPYAYMAVDSRLIPYIGTFENLPESPDHNGYTHYAYFDAATGVLEMHGATLNAIGVAATDSPMDLHIKVFKHSGFRAPVSGYGIGTESTYCHINNPTGGDVIIEGVGDSKTRLKIELMRPAHPMDYGISTKGNVYICGNVTFDMDVTTDIDYGEHPVAIKAKCTYVLDEANLYLMPDMGNKSNNKDVVLIDGDLHADTTGQVRLDSSNYYKDIFGDPNSLNSVTLVSGKAHIENAEYASFIFKDDLSKPTGCKYDADDKVAVGSNMNVRGEGSGLLKLEPKPPCTHNFVEISNTATCTETGVKTERCTLCGETKTTNVVANGHVAVGSYMWDSQSHWKECQNCAYAAISADHNTSGTNGTCSVCGYDPNNSCYGDGNYESDDTHHWDPCIEHDGQECPNNHKLDLGRHEIRPITEPSGEGYTPTTDYNCMPRNGNTRYGYVCKGCGNYFGPEENHKWVLNTSLSIPATADVPGKAVYTCEYNGKVDVHNNTITCTFTYFYLNSATLYLITCQRVFSLRLDEIQHFVLMVLTNHLHNYLVY